MHILVITNLYPPQELGGYGRCLADFAWGLQQRGHQISVLCSDATYLGSAGPGPHGEPAERSLQLKGSFEGGISLIEDRSLCAAIDQHNRQRIAAHFSRHRYDGILLGNLDLLGAEVLAPVLAPGLRVLHHVGFVVPPFGREHWPHVNHYRLVAASAAVRSALVQAGLPVSQAAVVYPGARVDLFGPDQLRHPLPGTTGLGSATNPLKIAFAGLLMGSKGAHTLVQAAALLHQRGLQVQVNLAGADFQAGYWPQLEQLARQSGLEGVVRWLGPLTRPQLARFFNLHHVGVFPSIYPEAFGIVGAEMQASGLALISSGVGGAGELVQSGHTGLLFQPGDPEDLAHQLMRLVHEPGLLARLSQAGQDQARRCFSVTAAAETLERLWLQS